MKRRQTSGTSPAREGGGNGSASEHRFLLPPKKPGLWLGFFVLILMATALSQESIYKADPDWTVPEKAVKQANPLADKPEAAAGGRKVFARSCAMCHGDERHERTNNAPDLGLPQVQKETDGTLFWRISQGNSRKGMPSFSSLPEGQRWQLVLYIRSLSKKSSAAD